MESSTNDDNEQSTPQATNESATTKNAVSESMVRPSKETVVEEPRKRVTTTIDLDDLVDSSLEDSEEFKLQKIHSNHVRNTCFPFTTALMICESKFIFFCTSAFEKTGDRLSGKCCFLQVLFPIK